MKRITLIITFLAIISFLGSNHAAFGQINDSEIQNICETDVNSFIFGYKNPDDIINNLRQAFLLDKTVISDGELKAYLSYDKSILKDSENMVYSKFNLARYSNGMRFICNDTNRFMFEDSYWNFIKQTTIPVIQTAVSVYLTWIEAFGLQIIFESTMNIENLTTSDQFAKSIGVQYTGIVQNISSLANELYPGYKVKLMSGESLQDRKEYIVNSDSYDTAEAAGTIDYWIGITSPTIGDRRTESDFQNYLLVLLDNMYIYENEDTRKDIGHSILMKAEEQGVYRPLRVSVDDKIQGEVVTIIGSGFGYKADKSQATYRISFPKEANRIPINNKTTIRFNGEIEIALSFAEFSNKCEIPKGEYEIHILDSTGKTCTESFYISRALDCPLPTVSLSANPDLISLGGSSTLRWWASTDTYPDGVSLDHSIGTVGLSGEWGVNPDTSTEYKVTATGPSGSATASATVTVIVPIPSPTVVTGSASSGPLSATLYGTVNPNGSATDVWFEWGTDSELSAYNSTTHEPMGAGSVNQPIEFMLSGLSGDTTYYYRLAGRNNGGEVKGGIERFETPLQGTYEESVYDFPFRFNYPKDIAIDAGGNIAIFSDYGGSSHPGYIFMFNSSVQLNWQRYLSSTSGNPGWGINFDPQGNVGFGAGFTAGKLTPTGENIWRTHINYPRNIVSAKVDSTGNLYTSEFKFGDWGPWTYIYKFDLNGDNTLLQMWYGSAPRLLKVFDSYSTYGPTLVYLSGGVGGYLINQDTQIGIANAIFLRSNEYEAVSFTDADIDSNKVIYGLSRMTLINPDGSYSYDYNISKWSDGTRIADRTFTDLRDISSYSGGPHYWSPGRIAVDSRGFIYVAIGYRSDQNRPNLILKIFDNDLNLAYEKTISGLYSSNNILAIDKNDNVIIPGDYWDYIYSNGALIEVLRSGRIYKISYSE